MPSVWSLSICLALTRTLQPASSIRPVSIALGELGTLWGTRHPPPFLSHLWGFSANDALGSAEVSRIDQYLASTDFASRTATLLRGGVGGEDLPEERKLVLFFSKRVADERQIQMLIVDRLFSMILDLIAADADYYGDMRPDKQPFWDELAGSLLRVLDPSGHVGGASDPAAQDYEGSTGSVESGVLVEKNGDVQAAAALLLVLMSDCVSLDVFNEISRVLGRQAKEHIVRSVIEIARTRSELLIPCQLLTVTMGHGSRYGGETEDVDFVTREQQRLVMSGKLPNRWQRGLVAASIMNFLMAESDHRAVLLGRGLLMMQPFVDSTPAALQWWCDLHDKLRAPLMAKGPHKGIAREVQKFVIQEFRLTIRAIKLQADDDSFEFGE